MVQRQLHAARFDAAVDGHIAVVGIPVDAGHSQLGHGGVALVVGLEHIAHLQRVNVRLFIGIVAVYAQGRLAVGHLGDAGCKLVGTRLDLVQIPGGDGQHIARLTGCFGRSRTAFHAGSRCACRAACGAVAAAAARQNAHCQNGRHGQHFFIQPHILSLLLISVGKVCSVPRPYHMPPARKCQLFQPRALDVRFVFRYNKNEPENLLIARQRGTFP